MKRALLATAAFLFSTPVSAEKPSGDPEAGATQFDRNCIACHVVMDEEGEVLAGRNARIGPNLFGILGAQPGARPDFSHSDALIQYGETGALWVEENTVAFIQDPTGYLRTALNNPQARSTMAHQLRNEDAARDVVAFLAQFAGDSTSTGDAEPTASPGSSEASQADAAPGGDHSDGPPEDAAPDADSATATASPAIGQTGMNSTRLQSKIVLDGLQQPWDMAFLDDETMFFTEQCLGLSVMMPSGEVNRLLGMTEAEGYNRTDDDLFCEGQAGMMGVAIDPNFESNRRIYVYSTSDLSTPHTNRLMRLVVSEDFTEVTERTDIVDDVPYKMEASDQPFGGPGAHNGGRVRFSPGDGFLYLTTGDNHNPEVPQSPTLMGSKVIRIDTDGNAAPDNAPPEGFDPRTFTYGHRNVQGIAFHPETHTPITAEHGPWHSDEITVLQNGGNGGWDPRPNMAGRGDCPDGYCGYEPNQTEGMNRFERSTYMPMTDFETYPDAMPPIWDNSGYSQGMSPAAFLEGEQWGSWNGNLVVGYLGIGFGGTQIGQRIDVIELSGVDELSVVDVTEMTLPIESARFRSLVLGPDGSLYAAVDEGAIYRLTPSR